MASGQITLRPLSEISPYPLPTSQEAPPVGWTPLLVPNFSDWRLGDIVLVEGTGLMGAAIAVSQKVFSPSSKAGKSWSHCGIYSGNGNLIDATPGPGVSEQSIAVYCQNRALSVLRLIPDRFTPANAGAQVEMIARQRIGDPFAWADLVAMLVNWGNVSAMGNGPHASAYCSALVVQTYARAAQTMLDMPPGCRPCLPSTLSCHPLLEDIPIHWCRP